MNVVELHRKLVATPSLSYEEKEIADLVQQLAENHGFPVLRIDNNVAFHLGDGPDRLLLNSHLDVVPPSADHPFPPFEPTVVDGKVFGRGTVDAKASGAAMISTVLDLAASGFSPENGSVWVALTACEEVGGAYNGLETILPHLPEMSAALVGEPTDLHPCTAQKGLLILTVESEGQTAHAARSHLGENAISRAARDIQRIAEHTFKRTDPLLGNPTATVTIIKGGSAKNVVPDRCTFTVDVRSVPAYTHEELTAELRELLESTVHVYSDRLIPTSTDLDSRIGRAAVQASGEQPFGSPTTSDWVFLKGIPTVKIGPGSSQLSHTPDEHIPLIELERAVEVYKSIITNYFA